MTEELSQDRGGRVPGSISEMDYNSKYKYIYTQRHMTPQCCNKWLRTISYVKISNDLLRGFSWKANPHSLHVCCAMTYSQEYKMTKTDKNDREPSKADLTVTVILIGLTLNMTRSTLWALIQPNHSENINYKWGELSKTSEKHREDFYNHKHRQKKY